MHTVHSTLTIVFILLLAVAGIVLPASARDISSGDIAFIYENDVSFTGDLASVTELRMYNSNHNSILDVVAVTNPDNFEFLGSQFLNETGTWYVWNGTAELGYIRVLYPTLSIDVVLAKDKISSVMQYGFLDSEAYNVEIVSPDVGPDYRPPATVDIIFRDQNGVETTFASGNSFADIPLESVQLITNQFFIPKDFGKGVWTIYARWNTPASFHNYAEISNTITMNTGSPDPTTTPTLVQTEVPTATSTVIQTPIPTKIPIEVPTQISTTSPTPATPTATETSFPLFGVVLLLSIVVLFNKK